MFKSIKNGLRIAVFAVLFLALVIGTWLVGDKKATADHPVGDGGGDGGAGGDDS